MDNFGKQAGIRKWRTKLYHVTLFSVIEKVQCLVIGDFIFGCQASHEAFVNILKSKLFKTVS